MDRDEWAALHDDFYAGVGLGSVRCHEEWMMGFDREQECVLFFSRETLFSREPEQYACLYKGRRLIPLSKEYRQKAMDEMSEEEAWTFANTPSITRSVPMRYDAEQYSALMYLTNRKHENWRSSVLFGYRPSRYLFTLLIFIALVSTFLLFLGNRPLAEVLGSGGPDPLLFCMGASLLSILNGLFSLHERQLWMAAPLGWLPWSLWTFWRMMDLCRPIAISVFGAAILPAVVVMVWNVRQENGAGYALEQGRNVFALLLSASCFLLFVSSAFSPDCASLLP